MSWLTSLLAASRVRIERTPRDGASAASGASGWLAGEVRGMTSCLPQSRSLVPVLSYATAASARRFRLLPKGNLAAAAARGRINTDGLGLFAGFNGLGVIDEEQRAAWARLHIVSISAARRLRLCVPLIPAPGAP